MLEFLKNLAITVVFPMLEAGGKKAIVDWLEQERKNHEKIYKLILVSGYPVIDTVVEDLIDAQGKKIPSALVDDLKAAMEESAQTNGVTLQNLDAD